MNKIDLNGKNAIVTGGARGIGLAIAQRLLASGARAACGTAMPRRSSRREGPWSGWARFTPRPSS